MAIRSISRLQHRRGLKSDLPPRLYEGELGWCLDTRELFIGNSEGYGGNTQLLTQWTPNDQLIMHAYQAANGLDAQSVPRGLGAKLDDYASVKDYGAVGDGIADDTAAIQLAITDLYGRRAANGFSALSGHVSIFLPAGTYKITQPIALYPFVRLQGDGPDRTKIVLDSVTAVCALRTADGDGHVDTNIGMDSAVLPAGIDIVDLWVDVLDPATDAVLLDRCANTRMTRVRVTGPNSNLTNACVRVSSLGDVIIPRNITLHECEMAGMGFAVFSNDPIRDLKINMCWIHHCGLGVVLGLEAPLGSPERTKVIGTVFEHIESYGIVQYGAGIGVLSMGNSFDDVGIIGDVSPILFDDDATWCSSVADQFGPMLSTTVPNVDNLNPAFNVVFGAQGISLNRNTPLMIGPIVLVDNNPAVSDDTSLQYNTTEFNNIILDYTIVREDSKRLGKLVILTDGVNVALNDDFTALGADMGITFGYRLSAETLIITYTSTNTGFDASMVYSETKWLA